LVGRVAARIQHYRKSVEKRFMIALERLLDELEEARQLAGEVKQPSAQISATTGKG
jgi:hypothetical protein